MAELGSESQIYIHRAISEGKSGAFVLVADVTSELFTGQAILKLDRAQGSKREERTEYERHRHALELTPEYAEQHLPKPVCAVQEGHEVAALTTIAARGLEYAVAWSSCSYAPQLETSQQLSMDLLERWNADYSLDPDMRMPQDLLDGWLDYRIHHEKGGRIHEFVQDKCAIPPETLSFSFDGEWFPNPLAFARRVAELPETARLRAVQGNQHGDLHGKNILVTKQSEENPHYYLIDLDFYREDGFLLYDHAIFELDYLLTSRDKIKPGTWKTLLENLKRVKGREQDAGLGGEDIGILQLVQHFRAQVADWIDRHEPNRLSFLDSQYLLARMAAGLAITHQKREDEKRAMAFLYAAHNLKDYLALHDFSWPKHGPEFGLNRLVEGTDAFALVGDAALVQSFEANAERPRKPAVAVLPFSVTGENLDFDAGSLTDHIETELSRVDWFSTIGGPQTSVYQGQDPDPQKVGQKLGAQYVVFGSTRQSGSDVQVSVRVVQTVTGEEVWSDRYRISPGSEDIGLAEDRIAFAVASRVDTQVASSERARAMRKPKENLNSWELFLRARWHFFQYSAEDDETARALCQQAIEATPSFSYPHALMAQLIARANLFEWADPGKNSIDDAVKYARHAITLDPDSSFAHQAMSRAYQVSSRIAVAVQEAETAVRLNPMSSGAHWSLAMSLLFSGKASEAIPSVDLAMAINPDDPGMAFRLTIKAVALLVLGRLQKAEAVSRQAVSTGHGLVVGNLTLATTLHRQGREREAAEAVQRALEKRPDLTAAKLQQMLVVIPPKTAKIVVNTLVDLGLPR
ncbi:MAG: hypothetical protein AAGC96_01855 [Pseudomonadota bacterium]